MSKKPTKDIVHAIKWLAAEFKFLGELQELLAYEEYFNVKNALACLRYVGKAERRVEKDVDVIVAELKEARREEVPREEIEKTLKQIEIPAGMLIKYGSLYVGRLRDELNELRSSVRRKQKFTNESHLVEVEEKIADLKTELKQLVLWVSALDVALIKAKNIFEEIEAEQEIVHKVKSVEDVVSVLNQPEKKRKRTLAELFQRRKQLRKLGLKGSGKIRREAADIYFFKNFNVLYGDLLPRFGWSASVIKKHLLKHATRSGHLVLFPLLGSLFNYYMAKGIHQEMLRVGLGRGLKLLTIQTPPSSLGLVSDKEIKAGEAYLNEQVEAILKKNKAYTISILDFRSRGRTIDRITWSFLRKGIRFLGYNDPGEHQTIDFTPAEQRNNQRKRLAHLDDLYSGALYAEDLDLAGKVAKERDRCTVKPAFLFIKTMSGKVFPLSHLKEMQEKPPFVFPLDEKEQQARIGFIKELLIAFGRVYYYLGDSTE